jgi:hypothetical protein
MKIHAVTHFHFPSEIAQIFQTIDRNSNDRLSLAFAGSKEFL